MNLLSTKGGINTIGDTPTKKAAKRKLSEKELEDFGNFGGSADTKLKAAYLAKKGLVGADQLLTDHPDISSKDGIINAQSDWKSAAISQMLMRARHLGLETPTEIKANRAALIGALHPRLQQAISHPAFSQIHPNYWQTFDSILKDQYSSESATPLNDLVKK